MLVSVLRAGELLKQLLPPETGVLQEGGAGAGLEESPFTWV